MKKTNMIIIMDGFAYGDEPKISAIAKQGTPNINKLAKSYPSTTLGASGMAVGLPEGQMGNSEVGHLNIGAGRIVYQELTRISKAISDGDFFKNSELIAVMDKAKKNNKKLHVMGLLSDGGVHSHNTHLYALIKMAKEMGLNDIFIHVFLDGRDVSPTSGLKFTAELSGYINKLKFGKIATVMGRYYAMDRDNRWDRVEKAYNAMANGTGEKAADAVQYIENSYKNNITDEFVVPGIIYEKNGAPTAKISENDSVIFFNFRPDRAREITRAFTEKDFTGFKTNNLKLNYVCMTQYDITFKNVSVAFLPQSLDKTLGQYLSEKNLNQLRIAETEKYAHVTFFFNGGVEAPNKNEDRVLIKSPLVATYDLQPEMSAFEVTEKVIGAINQDKYDVIILNYANCDMVGHTGIFDAAVKAVETVDNCVDKVVKAVLKTGGNVLITADHGNADRMFDTDGSPFTAHTVNPVPFILVSENIESVVLRKDGILADIAPTILDIMDIDIPKEMTGKSLIKK